MVTSWFDRVALACRWQRLFVQSLAVRESVNGVSMRRCCSRFLDPWPACMPGMA